LFCIDKKEVDRATSDRFKKNKEGLTTMAGYFKKRKENSKEIAKQHIISLFKQAESAKPEMAKKYVNKARKISSRLKTPIPKEYRRRFCKNCGNFLKPGLNARIRLNKGKKTYSCLICQTIKRVPYKA
jgi:ribonuclease P protein subunit RPR2